MSKKNFLTLGILLLMLLLLCYPNLCLQAAQDGLLLWFNKVLPSLLPFMIFINILVSLDGLQTFISYCTPFSRRFWHLPGESFFAFLIGLIAGYPMGAKVVKSLYIDHKISKEEAECTLCFCNNCGPLFIIGTVGTAMLSQTHLGYFLFLIHILSACIMSILITHHLPPTSHTPHLSHHSLIPSTQPNFFRLLNLGVMNAMDTIVCVGGYIILFSVISALLTQTPFVQQLLVRFTSNSNICLFIRGILSSCLELSNGTYVVSQLPISTYSLALLSAAIGFGGVCVYFQTLFVLEDTPFNTTSFFISKCIQGCLSFALTLLLAPLYLIHYKNIMYTSNTKPSFSASHIIVAALFLTLSFLMAHYISPKIPQTSTVPPLNAIKSK